MVASLSEAQMSWDDTVEMRHLKPAKLSASATRKSYWKYQTECKKRFSVCEDLECTLPFRHYTDSFYTQLHKRLGYYTQGGKNTIKFEMLELWNILLIVPNIFVLYTGLFSTALDKKYCASKYQHSEQHIKAATWRKPMFCPFVSPRLLGSTT